MKKLAIMFVMLLGSVATMQAQSNSTFDFSCETPASGDFTGAQVDMLMGSSFMELSTGVFQVSSDEFADGYIHIVPTDDGYNVYNDLIDANFDTLAEAIAYASNVTSDVPGFSIENVSELGIAGYSMTENGSLKKVFAVNSEDYPEGYTASIHYSATGYNDGTDDTGADIVWNYRILHGTPSARWTEYSNTEIGIIRLAFNIRP